MGWEKCRPAVYTVEVREGPFGFALHLVNVEGHEYADVVRWECRDRPGWLVQVVSV